VNFFTSTDWKPVTSVFGAAITIYGTFVTTILALLFTLPIGPSIVIFVTEIAPNFLKGQIVIVIELLAAIPSIIYGMVLLFTFAPIMSEYIEPALRNTLGKIPVLGMSYSCGFLMMWKKRQGDC
jgi:phosphate transport system permease protein